MAPSRPNPHAGPRDSVDRLLASWASTRPDLDLSPVAVIARLSRLCRIIDAELAVTFAEHGLDGPDFAALVTLRRLDQPGGVTQRQLMRELNLSSGTVSVRVERLADRGLVSRATDPADRRNSLITLTEAGHALFDAVTPDHIATENRLLSALSGQQRGDLACLLRTLLVSFEGSAGEGPFPRLGLTLAPAHRTMEARRTVGLPGLAGLLVRDVQRTSRAEHAGIRPGDVLVRAAETELRAITTLYAAINDAIAAGTLAVEIVRGENTSLELAIDLHPQPGDDLPPGNTAPTAATATHTLLDQERREKPHDGNQPAEGDLRAVKPYKATIFVAAYPTGIFVAAYPTEEHRAGGRRNTVGPGTERDIKACLFEHEKV